MSNRVLVQEVGGKLTPEAKKALTELAHHYAVVMEECRMHLHQQSKKVSEETLRELVSHAMSIILQALFHEFVPMEMNLMKDWPSRKKRYEVHMDMVPKLLEGVYLQHLSKLEETEDKK